MCSATTTSTCIHPTATTFITASTPDITASTPESNPPSTKTDQSNVKWINNPERIKRAMRLLYTDTKQEYAYNCLIKVPKAINSRETVSLPLKFNFNVESLLNNCIAALNKAGFPVKEKVFKGGAIHYVMDGFPASLRDFDVSLVIDPPKGNPYIQWQIINEIILRCLEDHAGLIREINPDGSITYTSSDKKIDVIMPIISTRDGFLKISLFEHVGGLENFWWWGRKPEVREEGEEYALYAIPAQPCRVELEVVASHRNSATCSLDALRLHYHQIKGQDKVEAWMSATDKYDVHKACSLRRKRLFYCHPESIPTIREGLLRYCSHLLKGFLPTQLSYEADFCKAFFMDEPSLKYFPESLQIYLKSHTSSKEDRIRYLLNLDAIIGRNKDISDEKKLPIRKVIAQSLFSELGIEKMTQKPEEILQELQFMRDYLYLHLSKNRFFHSYETRELCCLDDPRGREYGAFVIETPKQESLDHYLGKSLNSCKSLQAICSIFSHGEGSIDTFFCKALKPKIEKSDSKEAAPSTFSNFSEFLVYLNKNPKLPLKKSAKYLQNLFSFKIATLNTLSPEQKERVKNVLIKTLDLLKQKEKSLVASIFIEAFKTDIFTADERGKIALGGLVRDLIAPFSEKEFKEAVRICQILIANPTTSGETTISLFQTLLSASCPPKSVVELLSEIRFDPLNIHIQKIIWDSVFDKVYSNPNYHPLFMILWRLWNGFSDGQSDKSDFLEKQTQKYIEMTIRLFKESKDTNVLYWANEIASKAISPLLSQLKTYCLEFVKRCIAEGGQKITPYYMHREHILMKEASSQELFIETFSSFIRSAFPCNENVEQVTEAIKRGIQHVIHTCSTDSANSILKHFNKQSQQKGFPLKLQSSLVELKKFVSPAKLEEKVSTTSFKQLKRQFVEKNDISILDQCIDLLRTLTKSTQFDLRNVYSEALELFEMGLMMVDKEMLPKRLIELLSFLRDILNSNKDKWNTIETAIYDKCLKDFHALTVIKPKMASALQLTKTKKLIDQMSAELIEKKKSKCVNLLLSNPAGDPETWCTLLAIYIKEENCKNIIRCAEMFLTLSTCPADKLIAFANLGIAHSEMGNAEKMLMCSEEAFKIMPNSSKTLSCLAIAYVHNKLWSKAIGTLNILKKHFLEDFAHQRILCHALKIAQLGIYSRYEDIIIILSGIEDPSPTELFLLGDLCKKTGNDMQAVAFYEKIHSIVPENPFALMELGILYSKGGEVDQAINCYIKAQKLVVNDSEKIFIHASLGDLYYEKEEWYHCLWHYSKTYAYDIDKFEQHGKHSKIQFHIALLGFINFINDSKCPTPSKEKIDNVKKTLEVLLKKISAHKDSEIIRKPFANAYKLLEMAMAISAGNSETRHAVELDELFTQEYTLLEDKCIEMQKWQLALDCLSKVRPHLKKPADVALNLTKSTAFFGKLITSAIKGQ